MISKKPQNIPQTPGVYFFKNTDREIIYVGKTGNLKNRLASYFNKTMREPKTRKMLDEAESVDWQELDSEIEALIVEAEQIKFHEPKYNVLMRDGKSYSYVAFTDDIFPRVFITHESQLDSVKWQLGTRIGPFTDATALKSTIAYLRRIFNFCTCPTKHNRYCLNYHIGKCRGYCCLKEPIVTEEQIENYRQDIKAIKDLLTGRRQKAIKDIEKEMKAVANEENFEKAIELKSRLEKIKNVFENAKVIREISKKTDVLAKIQKTFNLPAIPLRIEGYDVANIQGKYAAGSMAVFTDGNPDKNEYKKFKIRFTEKGGDTAMLAEVLRRRFNHSEWQYPDLIVIDGGRGQLNTAVKTISNLQFPISNEFPMSQFSKMEISIIALTKNQKHIGDHIYLNNKKSPILLKKLPESVRNLILHVDQESHRFAIGYYRKLHRTAI